MKQCPTCLASDIATEFAYLIETANGTYWDGSYSSPRGFTNKHDDAIRFTRQSDAYKVIHWLMPEFAFALRVTQHGWSNGVHKE